MVYFSLIISLVSWHSLLKQGAVKKLPRECRFNRWGKPLKISRSCNRIGQTLLPRCRWRAMSFFSLRGLTPSGRDKNKKNCYTPQLLFNELSCGTYTLSFILMLYSNLCLVLCDDNNQWLWQQFEKHCTLSQMSLKISTEA